MFNAKIRNKIRNKIRKTNKSFRTTIFMRYQHYFGSMIALKIFVLRFAKTNKRSAKFRAAVRVQLNKEERFQ